MIGLAVLALRRTQAGSTIPLFERPLVAATSP
jgi:hypothetical protein